MMSSVSSQLDNVIENTTRLIELCLALQEENDLLKLENQSIKVAFDASKNKTKDIEDKLKALTVARSLEAVSTGIGIDEKNVDIKKKINDFVREIDKCIEILK